MALKGASDSEKIWNRLDDEGFNDYGKGGLMGNLDAESGLKPKNLQNSYEKKLGYTDDSYTAAVDNGSYGDFVKDSAGYGLAQWTYWSRKQNILTFARAAGKSIGDLEMQLDFLCKELKESYPTVYNKLKTAAERGCKAETGQHGPEILQPVCEKDRRQCYGSNSTECIERHAELDWIQRGKRKV